LSPQEYAESKAVTDRQTERERQSQKFSIENAAAQQRLEGLTISPEALEDMRRVADDEMTTSQAIERVHARLQNVALLES
jgi:hypothetical protein